MSLPSLLCVCCLFITTCYLACCGSLDVALEFLSRVCTGGFVSVLPGWRVLRLPGRFAVTVSPLLFKQPSLLLWQPELAVGIL